MEKVLYCFYKIILKVRANLKRHNRVYILSSKHSYRPMRARRRVEVQLFYKLKYEIYSKRYPINHMKMEKKLSYRIVHFKYQHFDLRKLN